LGVGYEITGILSYKIYLCLSLQSFLQTKLELLSMLKYSQIDYIFVGTLCLSNLNNYISWSVLTLVQNKLEY